MQNACPTAAFPLARSAAMLALVSVGAAVAISGVLLGTGHGGQLPVALVSGAVCVATGVAALLPVWAMSNLSPEGFGQGFLVGLVARLLLTLPLAAAIGWLLGLSLPVVLGWTMGWYLLLLTAEVVILVRWVAGRYAVKGNAAC